MTVVYSAGAATATISYIADHTFWLVRHFPSGQPEALIRCSIRGRSYRKAYDPAPPVLVFPGKMHMLAARELER
jgi:hypothetical protein